MKLDVVPCGACKKAITFRTVTKRDGTLSRPIPYDWPAVPCPSCGGSGRDAMDIDTCLRCDGEGLDWTSHFATCPEAARFRRGRKR